jgi:DNA-binding IclR family transcriptional regulator
MEKKINKKKIVSICPSRVARSQCPSIKKTRQIRRELIRLQKESNTSQKTIEKFRQKLKQKKNQGIAVDCKDCSYNVSHEPVPVTA